MGNCKISKEDFCTLIKSVQTFETERDKFCDAIEQFSDSYIILTLGTKFIDDILTYLSKVMQDKDDWISWWLYEGVEKTVGYCGKSITVDTAEKLYDFLVNYEGE